MRYFSRQEVESIGKAGARSETDEFGVRYRMLSNFWMYVEPNDQAMTPHFRNNMCYWESWVTRYISERVPTGSNFVDVGANTGYYTLWAASHGCNVIAFEPNEAIADMVRKSIEVNGFYADVMTWAIGDKNGKQDFYVPEGHSGAASLYHKIGNKMKVPVRTFDSSFMADAGSDVYVKIDAEGAEPQIWAGMQKSWEEYNMVIFMEWSSARYDRSFADELFDKAKVSLIEFDGTARPLLLEDLVAMNDLRMIVVERND
jgi:FkbM family methyltransferase